jgi:mannose-6-phosphate isomerase-like protein (cupin superfamily)/2-polyprenyl-3-methyl-5-hydroxy-6-metoxy-1,4-benzoquinol methylase
MNEQIIHFDPGKEFYTPEGCHITENSNAPNDPGVSIAQARIQPGVKTRWHYLTGIVERYLILEGKGLAEICDLPPEEVGPGDVLIIPPECRQRITNTGAQDLVFSCICTPGFKQDNYIDADVTDAMTPFGLALRSYFHGTKDAGVIIRREDGMTAPLPASYFFREESGLAPIETMALANCRGHVLDIGAGAGIHSLVLQSKGFSVTAIDISPELIGIMASRGVRYARQADVFSFEEGKYDTLLMLGHGIGICGDLEGLDKFLLHARKLVNAGGQILLDSTDVTRSADEKNQAYHAANRQAGRYVGDVCFRMEFVGIIGPYFHWLHVDPLTLAERAEKAGWGCEVLLELENGEYLARLSF